MARRNVVLVCLDTVRKDVFDQVATRIKTNSDIDIDQCRSVSSWTVPSHASMLTGQLPHQHGVHAHDIDFSALSREETFLNHLQEYQTIGVSANPYFDTGFGADTLFDEFIDVTGSVFYPDGMYLRDFNSDREDVLKYVEYLKQALQHKSPIKSLVNGLHHACTSLRPSFIPRFDDDGGRAVVEKVVDRTAQSTEPYFAFVNFMDAHGPFAPSRCYQSELYSAATSWTSHELDFWSINNDGLDDTHESDLTNYRELYRASIEYLDRLVDELIDRIVDHSTRETTFIITADHGENLGYPADDRLLEHKGSLSEGLLHVPLVIVNPPTDYEPMDENYFSHLSIGRLISELTTDNLVLETSELVPAELVGLGATDPPLTEQEHRYWDRMIRCVYRQDSKITWDSLGNTYEYRTDADKACHQRQIGPREEPPEWCRRFFGENIREYKQRVGKTDGIHVDESTQDRLKNLGYL